MKTKTTVLALTLVALMLAAPSSAQVRDQTILTWEVLTEQWNDLIAGVLDLTEEEAAVFWPLYEKYGAEVGKVWDERIALIKQFLAHRTTMSPEEARQILDDTMQLNLKEVKLEMKWAEVFDAVLPPNKVVRLFQAQNKLETMMSMEIVKDVPLLP
ncbi:MAG: hypothetical protein ACC742_13965 [Thermoanaerobaculales bacterium]